MGLLTAVAVSTTNPVSTALVQIARTAALTAGNPQTLNLPDDLQDGDLVFAWFSSSGNPTTAWSTPSGWTLTVAQKDGTSSFGGRAALFHKVWRNGDSRSVSSSGPGGDIECVSLIVRSDTDGASLTIGNPPASGFVSGYDFEGTVASTNHTFPKGAPDATTKDVRIWFMRTTAAGIVETAPAVASNANNVFSIGPKQILGGGVSGSLICCFTFQQSDPPALDAGTTTFTGSSGKWYALGVVVHDPNATVGGMTFGQEVDPLMAVDVFNGTGVDGAIITTGGGQGGGIAVG